MRINDVKIIRLTNFDYLRAISCFTVVLLHVSSIYVKEDFRYIVGNKGFMTASLFREITQMGVPCFVMLSGTFLLKNPKNKNFHYFYSKAVHRIGIPVLTFSVMYVLFHYVEGIFGAGLKENYHFNFWEPLIDWLQGTPHGTMWYMYMLIPMYAFTPFLTILKSELSRKNWYIFSASMMLYSILVSYTCTLSWILQFVEYIGYFMMGNVISELAHDREGIQISRHPLKCIAVSYMILFLHWYFCTYKTKSLHVLPSLSPLCVIASTMLFTGFAFIHVKESMFVRIISEYSFYIYLIHPFICEILMQFFGRILKWFPASYLIPLYAIFITLICMLLVHVTHKVFLMFKSR